MNIKFKPAKDYSEQVEKLYTGAFPKEERAPIKMLYKNAEKPCCDFFAATCDGEFAGLCYLAYAEEVSTLMFFAVEENLRGNGIGGKIIDEVLASQEDKKFFLLIEPIENSAENYSQRVARRRFYLSHGLKSMGFYVYEFGVVFEVLGYKNKVRQKDYNKLMKAVLGNFGYLIARLFRKLRQIP